MTSGIKRIGTQHNPSQIKRQRQEQPHTSDNSLFQPQQDTMLDALMKAANKKNLTQGKTEFNYGIQLNLSGEEVTSAFMWAVQNGHRDLALKLIDLILDTPEKIQSILNVELYMEDKNDPNNLLTWVSQFNHEDVAIKLMYLMSKFPEGMKELCAFSDGHCMITPLNHLLFEIETNIASELIDILSQHPEGIKSICTVDDFKRTPLAYAIVHNDTKLTFKLLDIMSRTPDGIKAINVDDEKNYDTDDLIESDYVNNTLTIATKMGRKDIVSRIREILIIDYYRSFPITKLHEFYANISPFYKELDEFFLLTMPKRITGIILDYGREITLTEAIAIINFKNKTSKNEEETFNYIQSLTRLSKTARSCLGNSTHFNAQKRVATPPKIELFSKQKAPL